MGEEEIVTTCQSQTHEGVVLFCQFILTEFTYPSQQILGVLNLALLGDALDAGFQ